MIDRLIDRQAQNVFISHEISRCYFHTFAVFYRIEPFVTKKEAPDEKKELIVSFLYYCQNALEGLSIHANEINTLYILLSILIFNISFITKFL